jgi:hypothetical protein
MPFQCLISSLEPGPRPTTSNHQTDTVFDSGLAQIVQALHFRGGCKNDLIHHRFASTQLHKKITTIIGVHHHDLILLDVLINYKLNLSHHQAYIPNIISGSATLLYNNMETNTQSY